MMLCVGDCNIFCLFVYGVKCLKPRSELMVDTQSGQDRMEVNRGRK